jgi:hypothetical protein
MIDKVRPLCAWLGRFILDLALCKAAASSLSPFQTRVTGVAVPLPRRNERGLMPL